MSEHNMSDTDLNELFKITYGKLSRDTFNTANVVQAKIKKNEKFVGKQKTFPLPLTFGGSVGSGSLPTANKAKYDDVTITAKKVYGRLEVDRETIKAATSEGAFIEGTKEFVKNVVQSYSRNTSRILFGNGDGSLGTIDAGGVSGSGPWDCVISAATFKEANWEEKDYVNLGSATDLFEITEVTPSTRTVELTRVTGSSTPAAADVVYMQGSKDNDPYGLKQVCDATSGNLYGLAVQRRFQAYQKAAAGAGVTSDLLNEAVLAQDKRCGVLPDLIVMSYVQYRKYLALLEDQKVYDISPRDKNLEGMVSFKGIQFISTSGIIPVIVDRFVEDDRIYLLNTDFIEMHKRPDFGWFDDDGTVLLRKSDSDAYEARFGGYWEYFIHPTFQGVITGLAV